MKCQSRMIVQIPETAILRGEGRRVRRPVLRRSPMSDSHTYSSDVAFTPAVKAIQTRKGSREAYAHVEQRGGWRTEIDEEPRRLPGARPTACISPPPAPTASPISSTAAGRRASSKSSTRTRWRSPITAATGNTSRRATCRKIPKAYIFVMDYAHRRRVKIWGEARVVDDDPALLAVADAARLQGAARTGDPVQDRGVGHQLPAAHPAKIRCGRCGGGAGLARCADRRTGGGAGRAEGPAPLPGCGQACTPPRCCDSQANSG